jgi:hypothetical protein
MGSLLLAEAIGEAVAGSRSRHWRCRFGSDRLGAARAIARPGMRGVCQKMVTEALGNWAVTAHFTVRYDRVAGVD